MATFQIGPSQNFLYLVKDRPRETRTKIVCAGGQAVTYFLERKRMANPSYIHRFIDILRSPLGQPLLSQLAASSDKLAELINFPFVAPAPPEQLTPEQIQVIPSYTQQPRFGNP